MFPGHFTLATCGWSSDVKGGPGKKERVFVSSLGGVLPSLSLSLDLSL